MTSTTRRFDLIVFDWDGTLFDSTALIARCIQASCADLDQTVPSLRDASYVIGMGLVEADYAWITARILDVARRFCEGRVVSCLEGGYNLSALGRSVAAHVRTLIEER